MNRTSARWFLVAFVVIGILTVIEGINDGFTLSLLSRSSDGAAASGDVPRLLTQRGSSSPFCSATM